MPQIIADTYEIIKEIGKSGDVVYLAKHLRLDKLVVVKASKRKITSKPETLRREVDALKNLSHSYIPQVYDFIQGEEIVYTVMDYIEGESLDKPLKRSERASQAQVVGWACQLLEALSYLHGRPPHGILHADIKPANIMLTPQGDIRLIDFNIALALGEEGAVTVGRSLGYASPEHLGLDFTPSGATPRSDERATTVLDSPETVVSSVVAPSNSGTYGKKIMLDVRSDIYGLGATLYHLLTGTRPSEHVKDVVPLSDKDYSYGIATIINKAMNPNPDLRFQTAAEMLYAFEHLRENDPRTIWYKRISRITALLCVAVFLAGTFTAFTGLKRMQSEQTSLTLAEYSANSLADGDKQLALSNALNALPAPGFFVPLYTSQAQKALADALGEYDMSDGYKPYKSITLNSEAIKAAISPDGKTAAAMSLGILTVFDTETADIIAELPTVDSALADAEFAGNDTIIYAGADGIAAYSISNRTKLWNGSTATNIAVSAEGGTIAAVNREDTVAAIYSSEGKFRVEVPFSGKHLRVVTNDRLGDPKDNIFALSADGSLLAVSFSDGTLKIFDLRDSENDIELLDPSDYTHFEGGFFGQYFAFSATSNKESLFAVIDTVELAETISTTLPARIGVTVNEDGIFMSYNSTHVIIDPLKAVQTPIDYDPADIMTGVYRIESSLDSPIVRVLKYEEHSDAEIFSYDPNYLHDEARISSDGKTVMLFSVDGFRLYSIDGALISDTALPSPGDIYDQQYRRVDGKSYLEIIYYDGTVRKYSASDGALISETKGELPDKSLYEEFVTDEIKITSPLHGTPVAYSLKTGKQIRELEKDAYLTYVTQSGEYIITEYTSVTDDSRYGLLLDSKTCETLAYLPNLCDVIGDRLIFDLQSINRLGSLRETRIFTIAELIDLAKKNKEG